MLHFALEFRSVLAFGGEGLENTLPNTALTPSNIAIIDGRVWAVSVG
jgi:hypothetical protein